MIAKVTGTVFFPRVGSCPRYAWYCRNGDIGGLLNLECIVE